MKEFLIGIAAAAAVFGMLNANAGLVNDVPSCYAANHLPYKSAGHDKLIYVLIDQTVQLDQNLQNSVISNINRLLGPGTKFVIAEFSAFSQGRYLNVLHTGNIELPLTEDEAGNVPISKLPNFKSCMIGQAKFSVKMADKAARNVMKASASSLDQSDIMAALKTVSSAVKNDSAKKKVVFVVTDGLENSSIMSFYAHHTIETISPTLEIQKAKTSNMFGDFGGAKVYMLGGAMLPPAKSGSREVRDGYRNPKILNNLKEFWADYFKNSNSKLEEIGEPALLETISY